MHITIRYFLLLFQYFLYWNFVCKNNKLFLDKSLMKSSLGFVHKKTNYMEKVNNLSFFLSINIILILLKTYEILYYPQSGSEINCLY